MSPLPMLLLLSGPALADEEACREPLALRMTLPGPDTTDVPVDARVLVGFIGWGEAEEFRVELIAGAEPVAAEAESWCYLHEGPHERHCWWSLRPTEPLDANTEHRIKVRSTETYTGEDHESTHRFTTGEGTSLPPPEAPTGEIGEAWDEESGETCDFASARRTLMNIQAGDPREEGLGVFHLYEIVEGTDTEPLVHTIRTIFDEGGVDTGPGVEWNVKQYLDASSSPTDCFRVVAENAAGQAGASTVLCYGDADTGGGETGGGETGGEDTGVGDGGDEGAEDTGEDPVDSGQAGDPPTTPPADEGGCGGKAAAVLLLAGVLVRRRRQGGVVAPVERSNRP